MPATFFLVGRARSRHPGLLRADPRARAGDEVGIHTFTHPDLATVAGLAARVEVGETQPAIAGAAGVSTHLLRPPYSSSPTRLDDLH